MHTHTITKRVAGSGAQTGGEVLIEKASSFQEFAAEERQHNKVIKKGCVICQGLSQDCHTLTDMNLHKQIIFSALLTVCESVYLFVEYEKRNQIPRATITVHNSLSTAIK